MRTHSEPNVNAGVVDYFAQPTTVNVVCQAHAQEVTAEGYTNDAWAKLTDGSWVTVIYIKGPAWLTAWPPADPVPRGACPRTTGVVMWSQEVYGVEGLEGAGGEPSGGERPGRLRVREVIPLSVTWDTSAGWSMPTNVS